MHGTRKCHFWKYDIYCSNLLIEANEFHEKENYLEQKKYIITIADLKFYKNAFYLFSYTYANEWSAASD